MVEPIPEEVLIHSVLYQELKGDGRYGEEYEEPIKISNVLVQPASSIRRSNIAEEIVFNSILFFDVVNSKSDTDFTFKEKSIVEFEGKKMVVHKVNPIYALSLHHYEIELI